VRDTTCQAGAATRGAAAIGALAAAALTLGLALALVPPAAAQSSVTTRLGALRFLNGYPDDKTRQALSDELDFQRAVQSVLWAEPLVNAALFRNAMRLVGVSNLGAVITDARVQPGQEVLTPTQAVVYESTWFDLHDTGPVVYEIPAGPLNAGIFDAWMRPVQDMGRVGPDGGQGGKYLLLPPDFKGEPPQGDFHVVPTRTYNNFTVTRALLGHQMTPQEGVNLVRRIKVYRLAQADNPPERTVLMMGDPVAGGRVFLVNRPRGMDYWVLLHSMLDEETVEERDLGMRGLLAAIGIEKGRSFTPDARLSPILTEAERVGRSMLINEAFDPRHNRQAALYPGTQWMDFAWLLSVHQDLRTYTDVTGRMIAFYLSTGSQAALDPTVKPVPGVGAAILAACKDRDGNWLTGQNSYQLRVPKSVPARDFWSLTVYDTDTRALVASEQRVPELSSQLSGLQFNADGSVDLYIGPKAPGGKESNWIQTLPGRGWFAYFRLFGPTESFHDRSWTLPDFQRQR